MKKQKFIDRWADHNWLYANIVLGVIMFVVLIWNWNLWDVPQKLMCAMCVIIPMHNFEEYCFPGGFYFMNNLKVGSKDPMLYPQNKLLTVITNNGAELFLIVFTLLAPGLEMGVVVFIIAFGYMETMMHLLMGVQMWKRYRPIGKKSIYAPGLTTCITVFVGISTIGLKWFAGQNFGMGDIVQGIVLLLSFMVPLLLLPLGVFSKIHLERFRLEGLGYFEIYERKLQELNESGEAKLK